MRDTGDTTGREKKKKTASSLMELLWLIMGNAEELHKQMTTCFCSNYQTGEVQSVMKSLEMGVLME